MQPVRGIQQDANGTYYNVSGIRLAIDGMKTEDTEGTTSGIWNAILGWQLPPAEDYIIRPEEKNKHGYSDLHAFQYKVQANQPTRQCHFLITQCKRRNAEGQESVWRTGREELGKYFRSVKTKSHGHRMYGIVAVGRKVEFVEFDRQTNNLQDIPIPIKSCKKTIRHAERGKRFWIDRDCEQVQAFLNYIKDRH
ncbi:uncharacterized protein TRUGW13939_10055 [Talaromyces rugulosus]|uniref:Fungal-type protein kinase domain-containing protein n=1 Tax=Talaromyces rugulosus TaxID=121627 RepID=A0A7H8R9T8_TALRU|nr:uncharacterized protein TRUGW13939_10055 [Talaromyces rugulosus]QKX62887.1 hypothetical protein TRUGW13939_10055 [Talaromyces rugulosus]